MVSIREKQALEYRVYEPTREEIRRACDAIQVTWSPGTRAKRLRRPSAARWLAPTIRLADLFDSLTGRGLDEPGQVR